MSANRRDIDYLRVIEDASNRIQEYAKNLSWLEYLQDHKTQDAIVHNLEVIGEATKSLSDYFRSKYPDIPWREMMGTRDRLTHHYFGVNQEIVWQIVQQDLPKLEPQIELIISNLAGKDA